MPEGSGDESGQLFGGQIGRALVNDALRRADQLADSGDGRGYVGLLVDLVSAALALLALPRGGWCPNLNRSERIAILSRLLTKYGTNFTIQQTIGAVGAQATKQRYLASDREFGSPCEV